MTVFRLGERVALKPHVAETRFDHICAGESRAASAYHNAKIIEGMPSACWHTTSKIIRVFQDGGLLIENSYGFVRQADPGTIMKRYD
jgi:hypothetical protein